MDSLQLGGKRRTAKKSVKKTASKKSAKKSTTKKRGEVGHQQPRQIVEIETERAPVVLQNLAELIAAVERDGREQHAPARGVEQVGEDVAEQPPDLPMQHLCGAEAEQGIDHMARIDDGENVRDDIADANDHHQIWDALIAVFQAALPRL